MTKPITEQRLYNITLFYLERFDASSLKIKQMLERRIYKEKQKGAFIPNDTDKIIQSVIQRMQSLGYINDERYTQNQVRNLAQAGKSKKQILNKLKQSGISDKLILETLTAFEEDNESSDLTRAEKWLKKHKKGQFRTKNTSEFYKKDLAALARAGFSYETAVTALKIEPNFEQDWIE